MRLIGARPSSTAFVFLLLNASACGSSATSASTGDDAGVDGHVAKEASSGCPVGSSITVNGACVKQDAGIQDASSQSDHTVVDAATSDGKMSDGNLGGDAGSGDAHVADAGHPDVETHDAGADDSGHTDAKGGDASVGIPGCVVDVYGNYYIRTDGTAVSMKTTPNSVVFNSTTGEPLATVVKIMEQSDHACGLLSDGTVWCWPHVLNSGNTNGDLGNGHKGGNQGGYVATQVVTQPEDAGTEKYLTNVTSISLRSTSTYNTPTCAIRDDRTLYCWGDPGSQGSALGGILAGTLGSNNSIEYAVPIALTAPDGGMPTSVKADQVTIGGSFACYLDGGKVDCWGSNTAGYLGTGDTVVHLLPVAVEMGFGLPTTVDTLSAGYDFACAVSGGKVWCWGGDSQNQIANPYITTQICNLNYCQPYPIPIEMTAADGGADQTALIGITQINGGYFSICALGTGGDIFCWGAGGSATKEAALYSSGSMTVPSTNVAKLSSHDQGIASALRYLTTNGTLVDGTTVVTPVCP